MSNQLVGHRGSRSFCHPSRVYDSPVPPVNFILCSALLLTELVSHFGYVLWCRLPSLFAPQTLVWDQSHVNDLNSLITL